MKKIYRFRGHDYDISKPFQKKTLLWLLNKEKDRCFKELEGNIPLINEYIEKIKKYEENNNKR